MARTKTDIPFFIHTQYFIETTLVNWVRSEFQAEMEIVLKLGDQKGFQVLPKRWAIERKNAWVSRNRRMARDYERLPETSKSFIYVLMIRLGLRPLADTCSSY